MSVLRSFQAHASFIKVSKAGPICLLGWLVETLFRLSWNRWEHYGTDVFRSTDICSHYATYPCYIIMCLWDGNCYWIKTRWDGTVERLEHSGRMDSILLSLWSNANWSRIRIDNLFVLESMVGRNWNKSRISERGSPVAWSTQARR